MRQSSSYSRPKLRWLAALGSDRGSASIEFLSVGVVLLVPLVYLVLALGQIQHAVLGLEGGSRHAARVLAAADTHDEGMAAADRALLVAFTDAGIDPTRAKIAVTCAPRPDDCTTPDGRVIVETAATVAMPFAPSFLGFDQGLAVPVSAMSVQPVSAFAKAP